MYTYFYSYKLLLISILAARLVNFLSDQKQLTNCKFPPESNYVTKY